MTYAYQSSGNSGQASGQSLGMSPMSATPGFGQVPGQQTLDPQFLNFSKILPVAWQIIKSLEAQPGAAPMSATPGFGQGQGQQLDPQFLNFSKILPVAWQIIKSLEAQPGAAPMAAPMGATPGFGQGQGQQLDPQFLNFLLPLLPSLVTGIASAVAKR